MSTTPDKANSQEQTLGADNLMPWERQATAESSDDATAGTLFDILADDPEFGDAGTGDAKEPASGNQQPESEDTDEPEDDETAEEPEDESEPESEDEPVDDESEDEPETEAAPATIEIDGEQVTLEEAKNGYLRQRDYTRKTQAIAEEKRAAQALATEASSVRDSYGQRLAALEQVLAEASKPPQDWAKLKQEDPARFAVEWAEYSQEQDQLRVVRAERERVAAEQLKEYKRQREEHLTREREALADEVPGWKDPAVAIREKHEVAQWAISTYGFQPKELSSIEDHRLMLILRKAMLYDRATTKGKKAVETARKKGAPVLKPGAKAPVQTKPRDVKGQKASKARMARLARTGSVDDAAAVLFDRLGNE